MTTDTRQFENELFSMTVPASWEDSTAMAQVLRKECIFAYSHVVYRSGLIGKLKDALRRRPQAGVQAEVIDISIIPGTLSGPERDKVVFDANIEWVGATDDMIVSRSKDTVAGNECFSILVRHPTSWGESSETMAKMTVNNKTGVLIVCWSLTRLAEQYRSFFQQVHDSLRVR